MRSRVILLVSLAIGLACGPETSLDFSGVYSVTRANGTCRIEHPEAPSFIATYSVGDLVLDDDGTGAFPLELPLPPCRIVGKLENDQLRLAADDCVVVLDTSRWDLYEVEYTEARGIGRWEDEGLVLRMDFGKRYRSIPEGLPDWWDDPGSCSASYELEPVDQPGS